MLTRKIYAILVIILFVITSCWRWNSLIYFDIKEQAIHRCRGDFYRLDISNLEKYEYYTISRDTLSKEYSDVIYIDSISKLYIISNGTGIINNSSFRLSPLSHYSIMNAGADLGPCIIEIWTDKNGRVIKTTKDKCKD